MRCPVYLRRRLVQAMKRELTQRPTLDAKPRKRLEPDPDAGIARTGPVWQLRVGDHRVFYEVDEKVGVVMVQRILRKGRRTTKDVLR